MPFTTVPDKAAGDVFTEAMWDTYIKDNLNYLWSTLNDVLAYKEVTNNVSVGGTGEAGATAIVTADPVVCDGTPIWVSFFCPRSSNTSGDCYVYLFQDGVSLGRIAYWQGSSSLFARRRITPSAGTHTYSIRASRTGSSWDFAAGDGAGSGWAPIWIRVVKAVV